MKRLLRYKVTFITLAIVTVLCTLLGTSCKKTSQLTVGGVLRFSDDTLHFDTIFTAAGSFTRAVLIYNPQSEQVILSSVRLRSGDTSYFHLNVDGFPGNNVSGIKIAPHDSVYVFATVNINPNNTTTPFIVTDELVATLNGNDFSIPITAYGQNAHYIIGDSLAAGPTTWDTDKPYVVIHACVVGPGATLNIPRGCRVYMHQDARIIARGNSVVNIGTLPVTSDNDSVVFQGDRLDRVYFGYTGYPGEWCGLWFAPGSTGNITHTTLKNCGGDTRYYNYYTRPAAIRVDTAALLNIDHSIIQNSVGFGIFSWQGTVIASNCLINTTGGEALAVIQGGYDSITNCTFANYGGTALSHSTNGTIAILNYFNNGDGTWEPGDLNGVMQNCIVYGSLDSEAVFDSLGGATASFRVNNCLMKMGKIREHFVQFNSGCIFNKDPKFKDQNNKDFHLLAESPAIDGGVIVPGAGGKDLDGNMRTAGSKIDIGCYESQ